MTTPSATEAQPDATGDAKPAAPPAEEESSAPVINQTGVHSEFIVPLPGDEFSDEDAGNSDEGSTGTGDALPPSDETPQGDDTKDTKNDAGDGTGSPPSIDLSALTEEQIETLVKDNTKVRARIDRLADNVAGNKIQANLKDQRAKDSQFEQNGRLFNRLQDDSEYREQLVTERGARAVTQFEATHLAEIDDRKQQAGVTPEMQQTAMDQAATNLDERAIPVVQMFATNLPFYADLPQETRTAFDKLNAADGEWLENAFKALGAGVQKYVEGLTRGAKSAADEAREAGANDVRAERTEGGAIKVQTNAAKSRADHQQVINDYGNNVEGTTNSMYREALVALGQDY